MFIGKKWFHKWTFTQMPGWYHGYSTTVSFPVLFNLLFTNHHIIWQYIVWYKTLYNKSQISFENYTRIIRKVCNHNGCYQVITDVCQKWQFDGAIYKSDCYTRASSDFLTTAFFLLQVSQSAQNKNRLPSIGSEWSILIYMNRRRIGTKLIQTNNKMYRSRHRWVDNIEKDITVMR